MRHPALLLAALVVAVAGCAASPSPSPSPAPTAPAATGSASSVAPTTTAPASPRATASFRPSIGECAARIVAGLSGRERAGQLVMVGVVSASASELAVLRRERIGSVIIMGNHPDGVDGVRRLTARLSWPDQRLPLLVAVDQEGGLVQRLTGPGFDPIPSARRQATLTDAELESRAGRWGRQLAAAGVQWTLAPVADVVPPGMAARNAPIGALGRGYGSNAKAVAAKVAAFVRGMESSGVATAVKHFPGIGRVAGNTDFTAGVVDDRTTADDPYLQPFAAAIRAGSASVMVSTVRYARIDRGSPAVFSSTVLGVLRDRLGFDGVVISDDLGVARSMSAVPAVKRAVGFVRAGGDVAITVSPAYAEEFVAGIVDAAADDPEVAGLVETAATRVITMKLNLGLLPCE